VPRAAGAAGIATGGIRPRTSLGWQYALAHYFFCPHRDPIRSAAEGIDALRRGSTVGLRRPEKSRRQQLEQHQVIAVDELGLVEVARTDSISADGRRTICRASAAE